MLLMSIIVRDSTYKALLFFSQYKPKFRVGRINVPKKPNLNDDSQQCSNYPKGITVPDLVILESLF